MSVLMYDVPDRRSFTLELRGTNLAKPLAPCWERCRHRWRNVVRRPLLYIVSDVHRCLQVCSERKPSGWQLRYSQDIQRKSSDKSSAGILYLNFGAQYVEKNDVEDIQYVTFLLMAHAGLRALEYYDPKTGKHGQAHMQAR